MARKNAPRLKHLNTHPTKTNRVINQMDMIYSNQRVEGFVCTPWLLNGSWLPEVSAGLKEGWLKVTHTFFEGLESWPEAFGSLFSGANNGKVVVRA